MKKLFRLLSVGCLAGALCAGGFAIASCADGNPVVEGEYYYANYGVKYGVKVSVEIQHEAKGDRIARVTVLDSDYTQLSPANPDYGWTDANRQKYLDNIQRVLNKYRGMYVVDALCLKAEVDYNRQPVEITEGGEPISGDGTILITDATQSSGRLLLAVQDALCNYGYEIHDGEYHYPNAWDPTATHYGVGVRVITKGSIIQKVVLDTSKYVQLSDANDAAGWTEEKRQNYINGVNAKLEEYVGMSKLDVLSACATTNANGQPEEGALVGAPIITGATQSMGRILLAVQNALDPTGANTTRKAIGTYSYTNAYGSKYGVKVEVSLLGNVISKVTILPWEGYTQVSSPDISPDVWGQAQVDNYNNNLADLLENYQGLTVSQIMAKEVTTSSVGEPSNVSDSDLVISGATQSSGRILLAVQNAVERLAAGAEEAPEPVNPYDEWEYGKGYIDASTTYEYDEAAGTVSYTIVTQKVYEPNAFTINVVVGSDGAIDSYEIEVNGSAPESFAGMMADVETLFTGKTASQLASYIGSKDMSTGATHSNEMCLYAALFATANYDRAAGGETGGETGGEDEFEVPSDLSWKAVGSAWAEAEYINLESSQYAVDGATAYFKVVTKENSPAKSFTITLAVDSAKKICGFRIDVNGSSPASFADKMATMAELVNGKDVAALKALLSGKEIATGATKSNQLCVYAAIFGAANYDYATGAATPQPPAEDTGLVETDYIDLSKTRYSIDGTTVSYTFVTKANGKAQPFTVTMTVGADKKVANFAIVVNGSSPASFADKMAAMATLINGKDVTALKALLSGDDITTGATKSNQLCVYAAIFAAANYDTIIAEGNAQFVTGEYSYTNYGVKYGVSVTVKLVEENGKKVIKGVYINDSEYTQLSPANPDYGWTDENRQVYIDGEQELLDSYIGLTTDEVNNMTTTINGIGEPHGVSEDAPLITGATQSCGRLLLAVQNAIKNAQ